MNARILLLLAALALTVAHAAPRKGKKPDPARKTRTTAKAAASATTIDCDTIAFPGPDSVEVAGFEKTLRATKESMIVTNNTSHEITAIGLDITYLDMKGRMLHRTTRSIQLPEGLPPGESRMVSIPAFDRQGLFYYHLSPKPRRATQATPFRVAVTVSYICIPKPSTDIINK